MIIYLFTGFLVSISGCLVPRPSHNYALEALPRHSVQGSKPSNTQRFVGFIPVGSTRFLPCGAHFRRSITIFAGETHVKSSFWRMNPLFFFFNHHSSWLTLHFSWFSWLTLHYFTGGSRTKDDISSHLRAFALDHVADVLLAELTRCQKVLLTFAKAFWPRAPHVLFVPLGSGGNMGT